MAQATDLGRQRNAYQGVLMGIDLGHGVHDACRASSFPTCLARRLQQGGSRCSRGAQQWKQPAKKKHQEPKRKVKQEALHNAANQRSFFSLFHCSSDGTTQVLNQDMACSGKRQVAATLLEREGSGRLEGTIIT